MSVLREAVEGTSVGAEDYHPAGATGAKDYFVEGGGKMWSGMEGDREKEWDGRGGAGSERKRM